MLGLYKLAEGGANLGAQPIRRTLSHPVYIEEEA